MTSFISLASIADGSHSLPELQFSVRVIVQNNTTLPAPVIDPGRSRSIKPTCTAPATNPQSTRKAPHFGGFSIISDDVLIIGFYWNSY
jgi:hypothetical protein